MRIDWGTLALQTVNVLVLVWLLARFLYRPVMDLIARRQTTAESLLAEAAASRDRAQAAEAAAQHARGDLAAEGERRREAARAGAEAERTQILRQAGEAAAQRQDAARAALARERDATRLALERQAGELALTIARRLLERLPAATVTAARLDELVHEVAAVRAEIRSRLTAPNEPLDLVTAVELDAAAQVQLRDRLAAALGTAPDLRFRSDPSLIAGVELTGPNSLLRHSWKADLERIARELIQDDHDAVGERHLA